MLPDGDIQFPQKELADRYDVVHPGFRGDLNRPGVMNLDPTITRAAVSMLRKLAPTLNASRIASDIILPVFEGDRWMELSDERLFRYTRFLMQHFSETEAATKKSDIKLKVRGPSRQYLPASQAYFGREYSSDGERLDKLCADAEGVCFLSDDYLSQPGGTKDDWVKFFSQLGVTAKPRICTSTRQIYERNLDQLRELTAEPGLTYISLRASPLKGIMAGNYALDDYVLDAPIFKTIQKLINVKPFGWKDRLADFAVILEDGWGQYQSKLNKELRYARLLCPRLRSETGYCTDNLRQVPQRRALASRGR